MRVVLTTESYLPYLSGVTVSVDALARGLRARGHEVLVVAPRPARGAQIEPVGSPGPTPRHAWLPSYQPPAVAPPAYRMPLPLAIPWAGAVREVRAFAPDVIHAHSPFVTGLLARRLARTVNAPLVFTHHTRFADYAHYLGPLAAPGSRLTDAYLRGFWRSCAAIVAPSEDLARTIRSRIGGDRASRVHVIPTGVDVAGIRALQPIDPRSGQGWPSDALVVGSLGRLAPEKSPGLLLDAVAIAAADVPRLRLLMVGGGPSEPDLRARVASPDLAGRVHLTGTRPRPDALARVAGADLFLFTSRTETQGLVLAEALSAGLPAVAVDGPGVRDSVRDGVDGVVVPAEPAATLVSRLAEAVAGMANDDARRREMGERARSDAERFSVERRVGEVEALYRAVAEVGT
jgi:glycosyltransferase involved in cell wall biosynthesis